MKSERFYKIIIICLLLLNIGILSWIWFGAPSKHRHPERPDKIIVDRLKLDEQQQNQFESLRDEHHNQMMSIQGEDGRLHDALFALLKKEPVDTIAEVVLLRQLQDNDIKKDQVTFEHFRKLRAILKPEQKLLFDNFISELSRQIMGPHPPGEPNDGPPPERP
jgi:hypothetical protein